MTGPVVVVTGLPGAGKSTLAARLRDELGWALLGLDSVKEAVVDELDPELRLDRFAVRRAARAVVVRLAAEQPQGCLVDVWLNPTRDESEMTAALVALGRPLREVLCEVDGETAVARYAARERHPAHLPADEASITRIRTAAREMAPLGIGPHRVVRTDVPVPDGVVRGIAAWLSEV